MTRAPAEIGSAANSYEILAKLATGGMAEIFLARGASAAGVERYVVLKRVHRHRASDVHFVQMFLDEARLAAQLQHPNIAQVYDIGKLGDSYFFTMEYVHGETVRSLLSRSHGLRRQIPVGAVLSIVAGAAAGLHHAHERKGIDGRHLGIVHRDVSPSNLMVSYEGTVKVVDFGVAKAAHRSTETQSGTVKGKISYMSPEQCRGGEIDRRSDLFSLGIVMWEMLTTEKLFRRTGDFETMKAIVSYDVPLPSQLRPEIAPDIDHVVMRLLAKDPAERFQTGDELHEAIENVAVRTGSALSTASLGRYMRELFGQRPEPWIELQTQDHHPEGVTVTSEPIPSGLAPAPGDELDRRLSEVPALTQRMTIDPDPERPATAPLRVDAELIATQPFDKDPQEHVQTQPIRDSGPRQNVVELPVERKSVPTIAMSVPPPPVQVSAPHPVVTAHLTPDAGVGAIAHHPSLTPSSAPQYPVVTSPSNPAFHGITSYPVAVREPDARVSRALAILLPVLALGAVVGIVLALAGGDDKPFVATSASAEPPAIVPEPVPAPDPAPVPVAASVSDPIRTAVPDPVPAVPDPVPAVPDPVPAPAAVPAPVAAPAPATVASTPKPRPRAKPDVPTLFKQRDYADVVSSCASSSRTLDTHATLCTLAACKAKQASRAKRWFAEVPASKKPGVVKDCDGIIAVEKPAPEDECKRDPMACQY